MLSKEQVENIAKLARLDLKETEIAKMQKDLAEILDYIDALNKADTSQVGFIGNGVSNGAGLTKLRPDQAAPQTNEVVEAMLCQAPQKENRHIKVKEILT